MQRGVGCAKGQTLFRLVLGAVFKEEVGLRAHLKDCDQVVDDNAVSGAYIVNGSLQGPTSRANFSKKLNLCSRIIQTKHSFFVSNSVHFHSS